MATPLAAFGRIVTTVTLSGTLHKIRTYVRNPQLVAGAWLINSRATDSNDTPWGDAADSLILVYSHLWPALGAVSDSVLEKRTGAIWTAVATHTFVGTPYSAGVIEFASQCTLVLRDALFRKVKVVLVESNQNSLKHYIALPGAGDATVNAFMKEFTPSHDLALPPYDFMVGREDQYLNTAPIVGFTVAYNRKIRRRRGLA